MGDTMKIVTSYNLFEILGLLQDRIMKFFIMYLV